MILKKLVNMNKRTIVQTFVDIKSTNDLENALLRDTILK